MNFLIVWEQKMNLNFRDENQIFCQFQEPK